MEPRADDFDWVAARIGCSGVQMFERLSTMAQQTVESRNGLPVGGVVQVRFHFHQVGGRFSVHDGWTKGPRSGHAVEVALEGDHLIFTGMGAQELEVRAILDEHGDCRFLVDEQSLLPWQMVRFLLEPLLFRE